MGLIIAAILPITFFAYFVAERLSEAEREATIGLVHQRTEALNKAVERQLQASYATLMGIAVSGAGQRGDVAGLYATAKRLLARQQAVGTSIGLAERDGRILFVSGRPFGDALPDVGPGDMSEQVFATGMPQVSDLIVGTVTRDLLTIVHVPILRGGEVVYDLRLAIRPPSWKLALDEQELPANWGAVIIDRKGTFIARSRSPDLVGQKAPAELLQAISNADQGVIDLMSKDGDLVKAVFQKVPSSGWTVAVGVPLAVLYAPSRYLRMVVGLSGVAALCIGAAVAILVARRLSGQVSEAVASAGALGRGEAPAPVTADVRELSMLGAALDEAHVLLRQRGDRLALAFEAARAAPWDYDVLADRFSWSPENLLLFGFGAENAPVSKKQWLSHLVKEDRQRVMEGTGRFQDASQEVVRLEYRIVHPAAGLRWIASIGKAVGGASGQVQSVVGINIDITELKRAEEELLEAKKEAEEANRFKSDFLASASHDMRQPVQSMMMFTSVLDQELKGRAAARVVAHIEKAAMSLKSLLDELLDISRLDAGIIVPRVTNLPAASLIEGVAKECEPLARQKGLDVRVVRTSMWLHSDPALLEMILRNLIENAIKYTNQGKILVGFRRKGALAILQVLDTGIGIPENQLRAIFREFHQLDNPERDRSKGLGLGLSIVQRLITLLGHGIEVRSRLGRGSCFSVAIPIGSVPQETEELLPAPEPSPSPGRLVAVIDDEEEVRAGLELLLQAWECEVVAGPDHHVVLDLLGGRRPDLVIADYRLRGGLTGIAALREIERALGGDVRAVLLTGDTAPERIAEARQSGYEVLHKPITANDLHAFVLRD